MNIGVGFISLLKIEAEMLSLLHFSAETKVDTSEPSASNHTAQPVTSDSARALGSSGGRCFPKQCQNNTPRTTHLLLPGSVNAAPRALALPPRSQHTHITCTVQQGSSSHPSQKGWEHVPLRYSCAITVHGYWDMQIPQK